MIFPEWLPLKDISCLFSVLSKCGESRLVGGLVRSILLGQYNNDIDVATKALPNDVMNLLNENNIKCIPTGIKHGTVTAFLNGRHYEITTLREDVESYGRHAKVLFTDHWVQDAARRDFTINAMYMDLDGNIYDYFGGQEDLKYKIVKFVNAPEMRIKEDYLRILRYFRFYSYLGGENIDEPSLKACRELADGIDIISGERIANEMMKILGASFADKAISLMHANKALAVVGIDLARAYVINDISASTVCKLAALIRCTKSSSHTLEYIKTRWKLSNRIFTQLKFLANLPFAIPKNHSEQLRYFYKYGKENYLNGLELLSIENSGVVLKPLIEIAKKLTLPIFPITGEDLFRIGYKGEALGQLKKKLEKYWIDSNFSLSKEDLLSRVQL